MQIGKKNLRLELILGRKYYWLTSKFVNYDQGTDTDEWALTNHYISVVPVQFDVTAHSSLSSVNKLFFDE